MLVPPPAAPFSGATIARPAALRQALPGPAANAAETAAGSVSLSRAARDRQAAEATRATSGDRSARAEFDTTRGTQELDMGAYFTPPAGQGVNLDSVPLLLPSQKNIDALSRYVAARMPGLLAAHGIPTPPASVTYDAMGTMHLPPDYPYAAKFRQALDDDPLMERVLRTVNALASVLAATHESLAFQGDYAAAASPADTAAVLAKYSRLFAGNRHDDAIALDVTANGISNLIGDGRPRTRT